MLLTMDNEKDITTHNITRAKSNQQMQKYTELTPSLKNLKLIIKITNFKNYTILNTNSIKKDRIFLFFYF